MGMPIMISKDNRSDVAAELHKRAEEITRKKAAQLPEDIGALSSEETDRCSTNCPFIRMSVQIADSFGIPSILLTDYSVKYNRKQGSSKWSGKIS